MTEIMGKHGIDNNNDNIKFAGSLNSDKRRRDLKKITDENSAILKRIQNRQPVYNHLRMEQEWTKARKWMADKTIHLANINQNSFISVNKSKDSIKETLDHVSDDEADVEVGHEEHNNFVKEEIQPNKPSEPIVKQSSEDSFEKPPNNTIPEQVHETQAYPEPVVTEIKPQEPEPKINANPVENHEHNETTATHEEVVKPETPKTEVNGAVESREKIESPFDHHNESVYDEFDDFEDEHGGSHNA